MGMFPVFSARTCNSCAKLRINYGGPQVSDNILSMHNKILSIHDKILSIHNNILSIHDKILSIHDNVLSTHDKVLSIHEKNLSIHDKILSTHDKIISTHDKILSIHDKILFIHDKILSTHDKVLAIHDKILSIRDNILSCVTKLFLSVTKRFVSHNKFASLGEGLAYIVRLHMEYGIRGVLQLFVLILSSLHGTTNKCSKELRNMATVGQMEEEFEEDLNRHDRRPTHNVCGAIGQYGIVYSYAG